jgi:hypothetical protein
MKYLYPVFLLLSMLCCLSANAITKTKCINKGKKSTGNRYMNNTRKNNNNITIAKEGACIIQKTFKNDCKKFGGNFTNTISNKACGKDKYCFVLQGEYNAPHNGFKCKNQCNGKAVFTWKYGKGKCTCPKGFTYSKDKKKCKPMCSDDKIYIKKDNSCYCKKKNDYQYSKTGACNQCPAGSLPLGSQGNQFSCSCKKAHYYFSKKSLKCELCPSGKAGKKTIYKTVEFNKYLTSQSTGIDKNSCTWGPKALQMQQKAAQKAGIGSAKTTRSCKGTLYYSVTLSKNKKKLKWNNSIWKQYKKFTGNGQSGHGKYGGGPNKARRNARWHLANCFANNMPSSIESCKLVPSANHMTSYKNDLIKKAKKASKNKDKHGTINFRLKVTGNTGCSWDSTSGQTTKNWMLKGTILLTHEFKY